MTQTAKITALNRIELVNPWPEFLSGGRPTGPSRINPAGQKLRNPKYLEWEQENPSKSQPFVGNEMVNVSSFDGVKLGPPLEMPEYRINSVLDVEPVPMPEKKMETEAYLKQLADHKAGKWWWWCL